MTKKFYFTIIFVFTISMTVSSQSFSHYKMENFKSSELAQNPQKSNFLPDSAMGISHNNGQIDTSYEYYSYNGSNLLTTKEFHITMFGGMKVIIRDNYTYNSSGILIELFAEEKFGPTPTWNPLHKLLYNYDASGNLLCSKLMMWDQNSSVWNVSEGDSSVFTYSGTDVTEWEQLEFNNTSLVWGNTEKMVFTDFNSNNEPVEAYVFDWNVTSWSDTSLRLSNITWALGFNGFGIDTEPTSNLVSEKSNGSWVNLEKTTSTISNNRITETLTEEWNGSSWDNSERELSDYDAQDNIVKSKSQEWDGSTWELILGDSILINYGSNNEKLHTYYYFFDKTYTSIWNEGYELYYYYPTDIGIDELQDNITINLCPNPAKNYININVEINYAEKITIEIYNSIGARVFVSSENANINSQYKIDISGMEKGLYFVKIYSASSKKSMKFIKI